MSALLKKEMTLTASGLSYIFIAFAILAMAPGYPILMCTFFICFGIFQSYQKGREANDTIYTAMLPIKKADVVRAKYCFAVMIELIALIPAAVITVVRMTIMADSGVYVRNTLMNANAAFLGYALIVYACFNCFFICGFFKTAYKVGKPFVLFSVFGFLVIMISEALHFLPGLGGLNDTHFAAIQLIPFVTGVIVYIAGTALAQRSAIRHFDMIDL